MKNLNNYNNYSLSPHLQYIPQLPIFPDSRLPTPCSLFPDPLFPVPFAIKL
ncbi:hypothetical protein [Moorena bouillonii]|uniref:hypothetical protein n=1 Tax=Moorena bouillonii TaxID=207920 RepID=UPI001301081E|nr:hypothetical protein [Moorena bouillonii]NEO49775.1 hypothetical protein [Moorena sp. SIO4A3]